MRGRLINGFLGMEFSRVGISEISSPELGVNPGLGGFSNPGIERKDCLDCNRGCGWFTGVLLFSRLWKDLTTDASSKRAKTTK